MLQRVASAAGTCLAHPLHHLELTFEVLILPAKTSDELVGQTGCARVTSFQFQLPLRHLAFASHCSSSPQHRTDSHMAQARLTHRNHILFYSPHLTRRLPFGQLLDNPQKTGWDCGCLREYGDLIHCSSDYATLDFQLVTGGAYEIKGNGVFGA